MSSENALLPRVWELERSLATAVRVNESLRQQLGSTEDHLRIVEQAFEKRVFELEQQLSDRLKREVMLRDGLKRADDLLRTSYDHESPLIKEALAATADLEGLILCEKEPCRDDGRCQYAIDHGAEGLGHCQEGKCCMPLYRAWELK